MPTSEDREIKPENFRIINTIELLFLALNDFAQFEREILSRAARCSDSCDLARKIC
jgi:hypothetical protein